MQNGPMRNGGAAPGPDALQQAMRHQQEGRPTEAEALYRSILAAQPDHPDALCFLGLLLLQTTGPATALPLLERAVRLRPEHGFGRFALGNAQMRAGRAAAAAETYRGLLAREPAHAGAWTNLGMALRTLHDGEAAVAAFERALAIRPDLAAARVGLAGALLERRAFAPALAEAETVLRSLPDHPDALMAAGTANQALGRFAEAARLLRQAARAAPGDARIRLNLANALAELDELDEAVACCRTGAAIEPQLPDLQANLVCLLTRANRPDEALAAGDAALAALPSAREDTRLHWNLGVAALLAGDWQRGWREYAWRKRHPDYGRAFSDGGSDGQSDGRSGRPWRGEPLVGRSLLVIAEQGLGDTLQFARFLPHLRGGAVTLACAAPLLPLLRRLPGVRAIDREAAPPECDLWADLLDLPGLLGTTPNNVPDAAGYLSADPDRARAWAAMLPPGPRIGLAWAGNPRHENDRRRSMPASAMQPILRDDLRFVALGAGPADPALQRASVFDAGPMLRDFSETAAAIASLDLVVTVDTAIAHCAGALGRPVWLLLPHAPDWRWMLHRDDTPWYAGMRLFRQARPGDWEGVVAAVARAMAGAFPVAGPAVPRTAPAPLAATPIRSFAGGPPRA